MNHIDGTDANFQTEVLEFQGIVLVDFWAAWCGPCQMLAPIIEEIGNELGDKLKIVKVNVDNNSGVSGKYNIASIPTVMIFKDGQIKDTIIGFRQKEDYLKAINNL